MSSAADSIAGTISRSYDGLDRLSSEGTAQGSVSYQYDGAGRRTSMTASGQLATSYTWDNANRLTGITQGTQSVSFQYDADNRRATLVLPNGITATYSYDADSHLTGINYALGASQIGNLGYAYDPAGRMIGKSGSLSSSSFPAPVVSASYDASNELTAWNNAPLSYDANGNVTNDGTNLYTWDARNHLVSITGPTPASFTYDAFGRRTQKTVSGVTTSFLYDGLNPVEEITPPAVQLGQPVVANLLTGLRTDEYFSRTDTTGTSTYLTDMLGSTLALTNAGGTVTTQYMYEPFGKATASGVPSTNAYQFTGRENDGTGAYYYRARYYSPNFQRFIAQDPSDFLGGDFNLYAYVLNAPIDYADSSGLVITYHGYSQAELEQIQEIEARIATTERGRELLNTARSDPNTDFQLTKPAPGEKNPWTFPATPGVCGKNRKITFDPSRSDIFIPTSDGPYPASPERVLAHELGHAEGTLDETQDILQNENPVATGLGDPARIP